MQMKQYENYVDEHWQQPKSVKDAVTFIYTCLAGECGEVGDAIKKVYRNKQTYQEVALEIGDTLHYLTYLSHYLGYSLTDIMEMNVTKLDERFNNNPNWLFESNTAT